MRLQLKINLRSFSKIIFEKGCLWIFEIQIQRQSFLCEPQYTVNLEQYILLTEKVNKCIILIIKQVEFNFIIGEMIIMKIGVSSYSFQQYIAKGEMNVEDTLVKAAELGFDAIEFVNFNMPAEVTEEYTDNLIKLSEKHNIEISAYVTGGALLSEDEDKRQAEYDEVCRQLDIAKMLGVKLFRYDVGYKLPRLMSFDMALELVCPYMKKIADYGEGLGIMTMTENHGLAFQDWERIEKTYNAVNHKNFSILIDIGNFMCVDFDNTICVSKLANLASHVHLKDMKKIDFYDECSKDGCFQTRAGNYILGTAVGYGDAKAAQCVRILKNAGYDGFLNIEYEGQEDCIEGLKKGLEFARGLME